MPPATTRVIVIGLGYVGLPLAVALARRFETTGLDIDARRIAELKDGHDRTGEIERERLAASSLGLTDRPADCPPADFYIVTVPTPIDAANRPDLRLVEAASRTVAAMLGAAVAEGRQPVVVYESTVYPGVTEDICAPILEQVSGLVCGKDFFLGYSPERINPGDREHTIDKITKVVSGQTPDVLDRVAELYDAITTGGVFRAASIKAAEAAKVIENAQRDINIAFMNEIARIFSAMDLSVWDVLAAARTKWNFLPFSPGLVGGHCIGVDPYYLSHRAEELGLDPQVILAAARRERRHGPLGGRTDPRGHRRQGRAHPGTGPDLQGRRSRPAQFQGGGPDRRAGRHGPRGNRARSPCRCGRSRARIRADAAFRFPRGNLRPRLARRAAPSLSGTGRKHSARAGGTGGNPGRPQGRAGRRGRLDSLRITPEHARSRYRRGRLYRFQPGPPPAGARRQRDRHRQRQ
jgi:nucleotide sugar dehydrogenase